MPDRNPGFQQRTVVALGLGAVGRLPEECERLGMSRPVAVIDSALRDLPAGQTIRRLLPEAPMASPPPGEPTFETVQELLESVRVHTPDGIIAVGGGSTIDSCKVVRGMLATGDVTPDQVVEHLDNAQLAPFVAIPTTAGTGAEVGSGAIVIDPASGAKTLIKATVLAPDIALADGDMTIGLPPHLTAYTGLDAFAQAFLAYVSAGAESVSGQLALISMQAIAKALPNAVDRGEDRNARGEMMRGSVTGAMAMFNAPPIYAAEHLFAEAIGPAVQVHHGHLVAAFLVPTVLLNREALADPYAEVAGALGWANGPNPVDGLVDGLVDLVEACGVRPAGEAAANVDMSDLVRYCLDSDAAELNPVALDEKRVAAVLTAGFAGDWRMMDPV